MADLDPVVDDGNDDVGVAEGDVPGFGQIRVGPRQGVVLSGVFEVPLMAEARIVGSVIALHLLDEIRLGPCDRGMGGAAIDFREHFLRRGVGHRNKELIRRAGQRLDACPFLPEVGPRLNAGLEAKDEVGGDEQAQAGVGIDEDGIGRPTGGGGAQFLKFGPELGGGLAAGLLLQRRRFEHRKAVAALARRGESAGSPARRHRDGIREAAELTRAVGRGVGIARVDAGGELRAEGAVRASGGRGIAREERQGQREDGQKKSLQ